MKYIISFLFIVLFTSVSYSQNINHPSISTAVPGMKVNSYSGSLTYERTDLEIPCQGVHIDLTFYFNSNTTSVDLGFGNGWTMTYSMIYIKQNRHR
ncbi:MAG: hypothetical protein IPL53_24195 [Ignavibacteria bacterium]|nr:hypothetical protein [Ignavibacteria bacterium]